MDFFHKHYKQRGTQWKTLAQARDISSLRIKKHVPDTGQIIITDKTIEDKRKSIVWTGQYYYNVIVCNKNNQNGRFYTDCCPECRPVVSRATVFHFRTMGRIPVTWRGRRTNYQIVSIRHRCTLKNGPFQTLKCYALRIFFLSFFFRNSQNQYSLLLLLILWTF